MIRQSIHSGRGAGFTLVEAVMSMLIVSILLVSAMRATAASGLLQYKTAQRSKARLLADGLINDIMPLSYEEPDVTPIFGCESGETSNAKANYDDVDDFAGWTESPPQERDGTVMPNLTNWQRTVSVQRVNPTSLSQVMSSESGVKRITVSVKHNGLVLATRVAYRSKTP